ncbi:MAG TPA: hypothetical protein VJ729_03535 [Nitrososphaeraceae archaeon]|nr:hypothetical protein [Nitrososphaeraceae archaeon]
MGIKNPVILKFMTVVGGNSNPLSIATSASLVLISIFYAYSIASYLKLTTYPFLNRIVYYEFFHSFIFSQFTDNIVIISLTATWFALSTNGRIRFFLPAVYCCGLALLAAATGPHILFDITVVMSMPVIIALLIFNRLLKQSRLKIVNNSSNTLLMNYFAIAGTVIGIIGLSISLMPLLYVSRYIIYIRNYEYELYLLLSSFSAILLLLLLSCVPLKIFLKELGTALLRIKRNDYLHSIASNKDDNNNNDSINSKFKFIYALLLLFMLLSLIIALVPHQPQINPNGQQIGVDTDYYVNWINALNHATDNRDFFHQAFVVQSHGDKPIVLIFLFTITKFLNVADSRFIVEHLPLILGPLLVLVVFYLTREMTSNDNHALLASFFTSISFQVTVGIYAGFYANWIALIIGYLSFVFLVRSLKYPTTSKQNLTVFSVLIVLLLFTHIHTWSIIVAVMSVLLIILMTIKQYSKQRIVLLLAILSTSIVFDVVITSMTGSVSGLDKDIEFAKATGTGIEQFAVRWSNLTRSVYSFLGGQFSNFIIFSLGLCWAFQSNTRDISSKFLMIFMSIGLVAFLIGDYRVQARIFYDIPFQIPAAIALSSLWESGRGRLIAIPVCIWLVSLAIRAVSNFPVLHSA